jgi:hypothetical protein
MEESRLGVLLGSRLDAEQHAPISDEGAGI